MPEPRISGPLDLDAMADPGWQPDDWLLAQTVDQLVNDRAVTEATLKALREHFTNRQILDAIVTQGAYVTLSCLLNAGETSNEGAVSEVLPNRVPWENRQHK